MTTDWDAVDFGNRTDVSAPRAGRRNIEFRIWERALALDVLEARLVDAAHRTDGNQIFDSGKYVDIDVRMEYGDTRAARGVISRGQRATSAKTSAEAQLLVFVTVEDVHRCDCCCGGSGRGWGGYLETSPAGGIGLEVETVLGIVEENLTWFRSVCHSLSSKPPPPSPMAHSLEFNAQHSSLAFSNVNITIHVPTPEPPTPLASRVDRFHVHIGLSDDAVPQPAHSASFWSSSLSPYSS
ncbi:hypothetical protein R3P38DRAFT_2787204 [Favolaschia claudopus]|uniref:Uncharacterized protein n=1 Tax=Favolaschia claudopus TaxID=2862362 RepID=A0AAW0ARK2_9AGAR